MGHHDFVTHSDHDRFINSQSFLCLGRKWRLVLFPHGDAEAGLKSDEDVIFIYLAAESNLGSISIEFGFDVKDYHDNKVSGGIEASLIRKFRLYTNMGYQQFISRQKVLNHLVNGASIIDVRMKRSDSMNPPLPFFPQNPSACKIVQDLFMDKESADVVFEVAGDKQSTREGRKKVQKTSPTTFYAHRKILIRAAPQLAESCMTLQDGSSNVVEITNISAGMFHNLLLYIYGFDITGLGTDISLTQEIIEAADRYAVINLKLEAEARYVLSTTITCSNVMEHLLFADSRNCALLKEAVMNFIVQNKLEILKYKTLNGAPTDLTNDILAVLARGENEVKVKESEADFEEFSMMCVSELRGRAHAKGLLMGREKL